jgi:hypothetical protein
MSERVSTDSYYVEIRDLEEARVETTISKELTLQDISDKLLDLEKSLYCLTIFAYVLVMTLFAIEFKYTEKLLRVVLKEVSQC